MVVAHVPPPDPPPPVADRVPPERERLAPMVRGIIDPLADEYRMLSDKPEIANLVVVALVPVALTKVKFCKVLEPLTKRLPNVPRSETLMVVGEKLVTTRLVLKKSVVVPLLINKSVPEIFCADKLPEIPSEVNDPPLAMSPLPTSSPPRILTFLFAVKFPPANRSPPMFASLLAFKILSKYAGPSTFRVCLNSTSPKTESPPSTRRDARSLVAPLTKRVSPTSTFPSSCTSSVVTLPFLVTKARVKSVDEAPFKYSALRLFTWVFESTMIEAVL